MGMKRPPGPRRIAPELYDVSNLAADGGFLPQDSLRLASNRANEEFHTDSAFNALPTKWSFLIGYIVPPERGETQFADLRAACASCHVACGRLLVIWDNRCTLHRAMGYNVYKYKRDLRRATINEYGPEISSTDAIGMPEPA
jgi:alpha-ketoglutarate-dependent taurine dioxygenase